MSLSTQLRQQRRALYRSHYLRLALLFTAVVALWFVSLMIGETFYSPADILGALTGQTVSGASFTVGELRLPRATVAVAAGLAFGTAGVIFQTLLRNQLASPDIIGISAGAAAAGVTAIVFFQLSQTMVSLIALLFSLLIAAAIYLLSLKSGFTGTRMILIGIGCAALLQAWTTFVLSQANAWDLPTATRWLTGSLNTMSWERAAPLLVGVVILLPLLVCLAHQLRLLQLGDALSSTLGIPLNLVRITAIGGAVLLIALATATSGPIAFVAFMARPIASRCFRPGPSLILPAALTGALIVLAADLVGNWAFGTHYPVGVVTGIIGAPFLIYLLTRSTR